MNKKNFFFKKRFALCAAAIMQYYIHRYRLCESKFGYIIRNYLNKKDHVSIGVLPYHYEKKKSETIYTCINKLIGGTLPFTLPIQATSTKFLFFVLSRSSPPPTPPFLVLPPNTTCHSHPLCTTESGHQRASECNLPPLPDRILTYLVSCHTVYMSN